VTEETHRKDDRNERCIAVDVESKTKRERPAVNVGYQRKNMAGREHFTNQENTKVCGSKRTLTAERKKPCDWTP
jgi:hypothetical protein